MNIYKEMQKFNQLAYCVKADVIRVAPDLLTELIMAMKSDVIRYSMYTMDYSSGGRFIFGAQVEQEPYFPSMTFRIEGGCDHRWHELEGERHD